MLNISPKTVLVQNVLVCGIFPLSIPLCHTQRIFAITKIPSQRAKKCVGQTFISWYLQRNLSRKTAAKLHQRTRIFFAGYSVYQKGPQTSYFQFYTDLGLFYDFTTIRKKVSYKAFFWNILNVIKYISFLITEPKFKNGGKSLRI